MVMELTYTKVGDYYIPDLVPGNGAEYEIGTYGRMRQRFLEEHHHGTYTSLFLTGKLWKHLADIDAACMEWVGRMNNIRNRAEEIILHELVYTEGN